jgi:hypothetical protein
LTPPPSSNQHLAATESNQRSAALSSESPPTTPIQGRPSLEEESHQRQSSDNVLLATPSNNESLVALQTTADPPSWIQSQIPCASDSQLELPTSPVDSPWVIIESTTAAESEQQTPEADSSSPRLQIDLESPADITKRQPSEPALLATTAEPESIVDDQVSTHQVSCAPELPPALEPGSVATASTASSPSSDQGIPLLPNGHISADHITSTLTPSPPSAAAIVSPPSLATMAANIPARLKTADLTRFIVRAGQLETAKPVVAYWCKLHRISIWLSADVGRRILDCKPNLDQETSRRRQ